MSDGYSPFIIYLTALAKSRNLTEFESIELVKFAAEHERIDLLFEWIKEGKLT